MPVVRTPFAASVSEGQPLRLSGDPNPFMLFISTVTVEKVAKVDGDEAPSAKRKAETTLYVRTAAHGTAYKLLDKKAKAIAVSTAAGFAVATVAPGRDKAACRLKLVVPVAGGPKNKKQAARMAAAGAGPVELVVRGPAKLVVNGDQQTTLSRKQVTALGEALGKQH
jgi:hypothetical protein